MSVLIAIPGLSVDIDLTILADTIRKHQVTFGLDSESLQHLARSAGLPVDDLKALMTSPLAGNEITKELIIKLLSLSVFQATLLAVEEGSRFLGFPVAMACSFTSTYKALNTFLNMLAEDAQRVFTRALGLNTSV